MATFGTEADDRGVSPVIGVILMVAITVILAAVIGAFTLGLGDKTQNKPTIAWENSRDKINQKVIMRHTGGQDMKCDNLEVIGPTGSVVEVSSLGLPSCSDGRLATGEQIELDWPGDISDPLGKTIKVRYTGDESGQSNVIARYDVPA